MHLKAQVSQYTNVSFDLKLNLAYRFLCRFFKSHN
eukprot:COSAG01_NODE_22002_length_876_cov_1.392535_1_plen_34_part_10